MVVILKDVDLSNVDLSGLGINLEDLNYTILIPYNGTGAAGANPLDFDVNVWYQVSYSGFGSGLFYLVEQFANDGRSGSREILDG
jgi:hypothetical protein